GAFSAKMPLFQKQSFRLFLKFTPKRAGVRLRRFVGTLSPHPCKPFEKGLSENLFVGFCTV
ncbi:MAG: hypothetical protein IIT49_05895, partial [Clostridia bacterium]|nr:hypothetical protein [Clostridia bacterium]